ncbi:MULTISPECIES: hypothetical protein [Tsukamurella]|nr:MULTISPECIES: hypothetical protein [Tsukamurella]MCS3853274.1 hypothetical protein [Tsukamurella ocularis]
MTTTQVVVIVITFALALPAAVKNTLDVIDRIREARKGDEEGE